MASGWKAEHPQQFFSPGWHAEAHTPVVDGKYYDRASGEVRDASGGEYSGPPAVDLVIMSLDAESSQCVYRAARPFPLEALLCHIMGIVKERKLEIDSLTATRFAIRIILSHELTVDQFNEVTDEMSNGIWKQK
ncbi:hypothetical protein CDD82_2787 [Ophiocordyceps australis]|uniref:Uncharacterized protein n=1 Tax=Ophiocordyceps australis TaxID=1399860 RepID=A0A2C5ZD01_9HYPO|nr:hypothetical protein CDD82_2787 [Ophiocordyceps australis]